MTAAFLFGGGFWLIVVALVGVGVFYWRGRVAPFDTDLWPGGEYGLAPLDERRTRTTLYSVPPCDRRTENVVPLRRTGRTDKWT